MDQAGATARAAAGTGWATFAGVFFLITGTFHLIDGIAALAKANYLVDQVLFANLEFWGVVLLIVGALCIFAGWSILGRQETGRVLGIGLASVGLIVQLLFVVAQPMWALVMTALYVAILYALIVKGDEVAAGATADSGAS